MIITIKSHLHLKEFLVVLYQTSLTVCMLQTYVQLSVYIQFVITILTFRYRDNSAHSQECSPFWVGFFITFYKANYYVYCFIAIDKALKLFYYIIYIL